MKHLSIAVVGTRFCNERSEKQIKFVDMHQAKLHRWLDEIAIDKTMRAA